MKNMKVGLLFSTAALAFAVGCGDLGGGSDGGSEGAACTSDDNCAAGFACNPGTNACQETCTASDVPNGCPNSTPVCAAVGSSTATFCRCDSDTTCNENGAGSDTPYCNQDTGKCQASAWSPASCTPFTDNAVCAAADASKPFCNYQTSTCSDTQGTPPVQTCTASDPQPSSCGYGNECSSAGECAAITADTCANFTTASTWSTASVGPVIFAAAGATPSNSGSPNDATFCHTTEFVHRVDLQVYRTDRDWDVAATEQDKLSYFNSSGTQTTFTIGTNMRASSYSATGKILNYRVVMCSNSATAFTAGFRFTAGNEVCVQTAGGIAGTTP